MSKRSWGRRKKLIEKVKKIVRKGPTGPESGSRNKFLDCFLDKKITTHEEGEYRTSKVGMIKSLWSDDPDIRKNYPEILDDGNEISKDLFNLKNRSIGFMRRFINNQIHGNRRVPEVNEKCKFYIKSAGRFLIPIFFDLDKIKSARTYDIGHRPDKSIKIGKCDELADKTHFGARKIEWIECSLARDIKKGIDKKDLKIHFETKKQQIIPELEDCKSKMYENWKKGNDDYPYPGPTYGLSGFKSNSYPRPDKLEFHLSPSDFFNFLVVQKYLAENEENVRKYFPPDKIYPQISHSISPTALLIVEDGEKEFAVLAKRSSSDEIHTGAELIGLPICPTARSKPDKDVIDFFEEKQIEDKFLEEDKNDTKDGTFFIEVIKRGAREELGIELRDDRIKLLAFGLDTKRYLFNIIAVARKKMSVNKIEALRHVTPEGERQYSKLPHPPFTVQEICRFLSKISPKHRCPTTHMAAYYALCHRFDKIDVIEPFSSL